MPIGVEFQGGSANAAEKSSTDPATIAYNSNGKIASITQNLISYVLGRTNGLVTSVTDGAKTITLTRDSDGKITSWSV